MNHDERQRYWNELSSVEELKEFHPEAFGALSQDDQRALIAYYALEKDVPDVFAYKVALDSSSPASAELARRAYNALLEQVGAIHSDD
jgi:hypothetical protein